MVPNSPSFPLIFLSFSLFFSLFLSFSLFRYNRFVDVLIDAGVDLDVRNKAGATALVYACGAATDLGIAFGTLLRALHAWDSACMHAWYSAQLCEDRSTQTHAV